MPVLPDFFTMLPRVLAVVTILPLMAGLGWLTVDTTAASLRRSAQWHSVQGKVTDASGAERISFIYHSAGAAREVSILRSKGLRGVKEGEVIPLHVDPSNPAEAEPARGSDLWATPALLAFFLLFLLGSFVFLWRVKPLRFEMPPTLVEPGVPPLDDSPARFAWGMTGRAAEPVIVLRAPAQAWKANLFWSLLPLAIGASGAASLEESPWLGIPVLLAGLAGAAWLVRQSIINRTYELRCDGRSIVVSDRFRTRTIALRDIAEVRRIDVRETLRKFDPASRQSGSKPVSTLPAIVSLACLDSAGRELLRLDAEMEPRDALAQLLRRIDSTRC